MSFIIKENTNFFLTKLTAKGREQLSRGNLNFAKIVFLDREINYNQYTSENLYGYQNQYLLRPLDFPWHPDIYSPNNYLNIDQSEVFDLTDVNITSETIAITATVEDVGLIVNDTIDASLVVYTDILDVSSGNLVGNTITLLNDIPSSVDLSGTFVLIEYKTPYGPPLQTHPYILLNPHKSSVSLFYKVVDVIASKTIVLDRNVQRIDNGLNDNYPIHVYFFRSDDVFSFNGYGSSLQNPTRVWCMSNVHFLPPIGFKTPTNYEIDSNKYLGTAYAFDIRHFRHVIILHYTNRYTGNLYAEKLIPGTVRVWLPLVMYHGTSYNTGNQISAGLHLSDEDTVDKYDDIARTTYRELIDTHAHKRVIGRVYHNLKIIIITDPEVVMSLCYLSNRNYTLPPLEVETYFDDTDEGFCKENHKYVISYYFIGKSYNSGNGYYGTFVMPCHDVVVVDGKTNAQGKHACLKIKFPNGSLIYLRSPNDLDTYDGFGLAFHHFRVLIQEIAYNVYTGKHKYSALRFKDINDASIYVYEDGTNPLDPVALETQWIHIKSDNYINAPQFDLSNYYHILGSNFGTDLKWGEEKFFAGSITTGVATYIYRTQILFNLTHEQMNNSGNSTYNIENNEDVYITELAILDKENNIVAHAKPAHPIRKNNIRYVTFCIELDF